MLQKYITAHERYYEQALAEIKNGRKRSHWMWFIFPQIKGLGYSENAKYYAIDSVEEAGRYMADEMLKSHMLEICSALLALESCDASDVMGWPDNLKLQSSMTLFLLSNPEYDVFRKVLDKYFGGEMDKKTVGIVEKKLLEYS